MKLLVTGGCGFIGSNFVRFVLRERPAFSVVNLDKLTYAGNLENLSGVEGERYAFVHGDIADAELLARLFAEHRFEAVVNFAAESHVDRSILGPAVFLQTNVMGTQALLDAARAAGVRRFQHVSTDEVYGSLGPQGRFSETSPLDPSSPYSASKAASDILALAYHRTYRLPVVITRASNNYGPYQFPEKLIPLMITNALGDLPLPVYGDGLNVRDWIHVEDHCRAVLDVLERGREGEVYNVGAENERPNIEIVRLILARLGKPESLIRFVEDRPGHDRRYAIDAQKIRSELGWAPRRTFEDGLAETLRWYADNRGWWERVLSGEYRAHYERWYGKRLGASA